MSKGQALIIALVAEFILGILMGFAIAHITSGTSQIQCHGHTEDSCKYAWVNGKPMIVDATP
jgi:hypothetical protein